MTDDQWNSLFIRVHAAPLRVRERYARFVMYVINKQPLPF